MKRTLEDIRENLDFVGCDNDTARDMCDEIERLRRENAAFRAQFGSIGITPYLDRMNELDERIKLRIIERDEARALARTLAVRGDATMKEYESHPWLEEE